MSIPFYRPAVGQEEIDAVVECLRSGWLTTGPRVQEFERAFAEFVGAPHAVAVNSCTAALHLALDAIGLRRGDMVLVPTMTFAATAEVVRYFDATPVFVDCTEDTLCLDVAAARRTLQQLQAGQPVAGLRPPYGPVRAILPVHYGGQMVDTHAVKQLAQEFALQVIEDAAHTLPASTRASSQAPWEAVGTTAPLTAFSFYANKCITTGEGGMLVAHDAAQAARARTMALHGMSKDAWNRFGKGGSWSYEIVAPGFKYNLTDMAAALGLVQLRRAPALWQERSRLAQVYHERLMPCPGLQLPVTLPNRQHSWHLYSVRLRPQHWRCDRNALMDHLKQREISCSVHWMPLHMQPYYRETYGYGPGLFPVAEAAWPCLITLPLFVGMQDAEQQQVCDALLALATEFSA